MKRTFASLAASLVLVAFASTFVACGGDGKNDGDGRFSYAASFQNFTDSTTVRSHYEAWVVIDGHARSTGKFVIDGVGPTALVKDSLRTILLGDASAAEFGPSIQQLGDDFPYVVDASHIFITVEPDGDHDQVPSCNVLAAAAIVDDAAVLVPAGALVPAVFPCAVDQGNGTFRLGLPDLSAATGTFMLMAPTDDLSNPIPNDFAGAWFTNSNGTTTTQGLNLPPAPAGWKYEGWARVDGVWRSTGRFADPATADEDAATALQRGDDSPGPAFPGQDFVAPYAPAFAFDPPLLEVARSEDFADGDFLTYISVEPFPDNDPSPFQVQVLSAVVPPNAVNAFGAGQADIGLFPELASLPTAGLSAQPGSVTLSQIGLLPLTLTGTDRRGHFELFAVIGGVAQSVDRFLIDGASNLTSLGSGLVFGSTTQAVFTDITNGPAPFPAVENAVEFFVTVEPQGDADGVPSASVILAGAVSAGAANLTTAGVSGGTGLANFAAVSGSFQCDTITDDTVNPLVNDDFGILFRKFTGDDIVGRSLTLPTLPAGWRYEGWVEERLTGFVYSTGKFVDPSRSDFDDMTSASRGPFRKRGFPGEDFVNAVPTQAFAAAVPGSITEVMVTLEVDPDDALAPSSLVIFSGQVAAGTLTEGVSVITVRPLTNVWNQSIQFSSDMAINN